MVLLDSIDLVYFNGLDAGLSSVRPTVWVDPYVRLAGLGNQPVEVPSCRAPRTGLAHVGRTHVLDF